MPLIDGLEIEIADKLLRFNHADSNLATPATPPIKDLHDSSSDTRWLVDELTVLHAFMTKAAAANEAREVINTALQTVLDRTRASLTGFLGLDEDNNPLPRVVLPEQASVDIMLSRQLIQRVKKEGQTVWLLKALPGDIDDSGSLVAFSDAICVPLRAEGAPFGALHVYRATPIFTEREVRFVEMIASYLANVLGRLRQFRSLEAENTRLRRRAPVCEGLIGDSPNIVRLRQLIAKAAACSSTVMIHGETGSGKELVAHALHQQSERHGGPFVVANCGSDPAPDPAGGRRHDVRFCGRRVHRGRSQPSGLFEQADEGTLFLDEIGDMTLDCQVKVLRALEAKTIRQVGGTSEVRVDVRVIAASHKDLAREMQAGRFRQDLFYRLRVINLAVPPLREHIGDVPVLVEKFLSRFAAETGRVKHLTPMAMERLRAYGWPGNVRELRTVLESCGDADRRGGHRCRRPCGCKHADSGATCELAAGRRRGLGDPRGHETAQK